MKKEEKQPAAPIVNQDAEASPTEKTVEATASAKSSAPIAVKDGSLSPQDQTQMRNMLSWIARGGGFPERFDTVEKQLAAYNLAHSLMGSQWQLALNHIAIIHGQMCIYGEMPGTLAERTGEVEEKRVYLITRDYVEICTSNKNLDADIYAAVCKIKRKGRDLKEFSYTIDEAKKAGQYPPMKWVKGGGGRKEHNPDSPWEKHFKVMLMRKAMALAVKFEFPDALVGVPIAEYDFDEAPDIKDVTPRESKEDRVKMLNERFKAPVIEHENPTVN